MVYAKNQTSLYNSNITKVIECLQNKDFDNAKNFIHSLIIEDYNLAKILNLLAVYYELNGDLNLARKHYRASLALDPTLKCADNNLKRICLSNDICNEEYIDFGSI